MFSELVTNCILHKEYSRPEYVGVYWYSDHLTFINHNRPLPPLTIKDLNERTEFDDRKYLNSEIKEMFFALKLIQSYGSGIRRAKNAMADNASPKLVFEPGEEDEKDYTMVTAYINEEFAAIRKEEKGSVGVDDEKTTAKTTTKTTTKTQEAILKVLKDDPKATQAQIAAIAGLSKDGVRYHIAILKKEKRIERIGGNKGGYWKVND
jgi:predicted HTH transcriptional regulator